MEIGDIYYTVYKDHNEKIWICRLKVIRISSKGLSVRFYALDTEEETEFSRSRSQLPGKTEVEALEKYQIKALYRYDLDIYKSSEVLAEIIAAQRMIDALMFCPSI